MLEPEHLIAKTVEAKEDLGYLFWFSIGSQRIKTDELKNKLINSGLEQYYMPNPIRVIDVFRRVTKAVEQKRETKNPKIFENILVREVFVDEKYVQRNIVIEQINQHDKRLGYETEVAIIELDRKNGTLYFQADDPDIFELCKDIQKNFQVEKDSYFSQHIRVMVSKILDSLAPTPMRENGIIYFVPKSKEERVKKLVNFIRSLENSDAYSVPVISSIDNRYMVNKRLYEHLDGLLYRCKSADKLRKDQIKSLVEETNRAIKDFKEYRLIVDAEKETYKEMVQNLRNEVIYLVERFISEDEMPDIRYSTIHTKEKS